MKDNKKSSDSNNNSVPYYSRSVITSEASDKEEGNKKEIVTKFALQEYVPRISGSRHYALKIKYPNKNKLMTFLIPKCEIPKGTKDRILAIQIEDHDPQWMTFQGPIKNEEGVVKGIQSILQIGNMVVHSWEPKKIIFSVLGGGVKGKYLEGKYLLVNISVEKSGDQRKWLFSKSLEE